MDFQLVTLLNEYKFAINSTMNKKETRWKILFT